MYLESDMNLIFLNGLMLGNVEPDDSYFFYLNYTPVGNRMFFTELNGIKIDGIRQQIEKI